MSTLRFVAAALAAFWLLVLTAAGFAKLGIAVGIAVFFLGAFVLGAAHLAKEADAEMGIEN